MNPEEAIADLFQLGFQLQENYGQNYECLCPSQVLSFTEGKPLLSRVTHQQITVAISLPSVLATRKVHSAPTFLTCNLAPSLGADLPASANIFSNCNTASAQRLNQDDYKQN